MTRAKLEPNLKQAIAVGTPVELFDPVTNEVYYVLSADQYQNLAVRGSDEIDPQLAYPVIDQVMAEDDAHDPLLESYQ